MLFYEETSTGNLYKQFDSLIDLDKGMRPETDFLLIAPHKTIKAGIGDIYDTSNLERAYFQLQRDKHVGVYNFYDRTDSAEILVRDSVLLDSVHLNNEGKYFLTYGLQNILLPPSNRWYDLDVNTLRADGIATNKGNYIWGENRGNPFDKGIDNILIGRDAEYIGVGVQNTFLGCGVNQGNTGDISYNTLVGFESGYSNTKPQNTYLGYKTGYAKSTGQGGNVFGYLAAYQATSIGSSEVIGTQAAKNNTGTISSSVIIG